MPWLERLCLPSREDEGAADVIDGTDATEQEKEDGEEQKQQHQKAVHCKLEQGKDGAAAPSKGVSTSLVKSKPGRSQRKSQQKRTSGHHD